MKSVKYKIPNLDVKSELGQRTRSGYSLLLALLIVGTVLSTATAIARLVLVQIHQTRNVTSAMRAYSIAQSGMEQGLFLLRKTDLALAEINNLLGDAGGNIAPFNEAQTVSIKQNDFVSFPIGDINEMGSSPRITAWTADTNCASAGWIEVATIYWDADNPTPFQITRHPYAVSDLGALNTNALAFQTTMGQPIEMRIRALYCDINALGVSGIPGRLRIISRGSDGNTAQAVEALLTRNAPTSGLLDFVIFSECELSKGLTNPPACN